MLRINYHFLNIFFDVHGMHVTYINPAFLRSVVLESTASARYGTSFGMLHCLYGDDNNEYADDVFKRADDKVCSSNDIQSHGYGYRTYNTRVKGNKFKYCRSFYMYILNSTCWIVSLFVAN